MIIPAQVPSTGVPAVEALEVGRHAHLANLGAEVAQHAPVRLEVALERQDADERAGRPVAFATDGDRPSHGAGDRRPRHIYQPRLASS
jgi:hypothetical protein